MTRLALVLALLVLLVGCSALPQPMGLPGSYTLGLPAKCEAWIFTEESHVKEWALALACPGVDLMRVYPWPPVQPWDESPSDATPTPAPKPTKPPGSIL